MINLEWLFMNHQIAPSIQNFSFKNDVEGFDFGKILRVGNSQEGWFKIVDSLKLKSGVELAGKWVHSKYARIYSNNLVG